jgi:hypothetical protein
VSIPFEVDDQHEGFHARIQHNAIIDLLLPPSTNRLWRSWRGRVVCSKRDTQWREAAGWKLALLRPVRITGPVTITIVERHHGDPKELELSPGDTSGL